MSTVLAIVLVVMKLPKPVPVLIKFVQAFIAALTNNPLLPNAAPVVAAPATATLILEGEPLWVWDKFLHPPCESDDPFVNWFQVQKI